MRLTKYFVLIIILLLMPLFSNLAYYVDAGALAKDDNELAAVLPSSLQYVNSQAFAGTNIEAVVFYNKLLYVGEKAFYGTDLGDVFIPESIQFISSDSFPKATIIHGVKGGYAETWANTNGHRFVDDDIWNAKAAPEITHIEIFLILICLIFPSAFDKAQNIKKRIKTVVQSMRPQDRSELYPINYRFP